ncbi:hypothetical protein BDZ91DRAFT_729567 [Kalaharituber pfeilii]|nr:hypothetical protein BDZ91DRAFT_729567 [Kalaharituber pfeilii]
MPRRIWDLKSNRVVDFRMLHAEVNSIEVPHQSTRWPTFWAVSHSWTSDMKTVETSVNQYQWPVPLPKGVDIESLRKELLTLGADYVWLDVLCLRQQSDTSTAQTLTHNNVPLDTIKHDEWKIDVPTIGNIYRAAVQTVRYFNGLGRPFSKEGWDDPLHWLRRAWTLQEIRTENRTFNGGVPRGNGRIILNTKSTVAGKVTTLRGAIRHVLKLATDADSPGGCKLYELTREMASRCATHPTDKVAGLFYLLRATQLPTYDEKIDDETAWRQCFHVLPFGKKIEILFDFPYQGQNSNGSRPGSNLREPSNIFFSVKSGQFLMLSFIKQYANSLIGKMGDAGQRMEMRLLLNSRFSKRLGSLEQIRTVTSWS